MKEISIKIKRDDEELVTYELMEYGITSLEVVDDALYKSLNKDEISWDYYDLPNGDGEYITIKCYIDEGVKDELVRFVMSLGVEVCFSDRTIEEKDYENDWKSYFKPIEVSERLKVVPVWERDKEHTIVLNPGMAFGTGSHETTFLMLKEIDSRLSCGTVLDVGTGSGILAIASAKLFGCTADAYEIDPLAIKSAEENLSLNGVSDMIRLHLGDFTKDEVKQYDFILSNIYAETLVIFMPEFKKRMKNGALILLSGIIADKLPMIKKAFDENGIDYVGEETLNGWARITGKLMF